MKILFCVLILWSVVSVSLAAVGLSLPSTHPDHPGKCWDDSENKAYSVGTHTPIGKCIRIECADDFSLHWATCGVVSAGEGFHTESDNTKPYPECCPRIFKN